MNGQGPLLVLLLVPLGLLVPVIWLLLGRVRLADTVRARLRALDAGSHGGRTASAPRRHWALPVAALGRLVMRSGLLPTRALQDAEALLRGANLHNEAVLAGYVGGKVLLLAALPALGRGLVGLAGGGGAMGGHAGLVAMVAGAAAALLLPDLLLGHRRARRLAALESGLADALDLLVICLDAGLTFEHALERVAHEIAPVYPILASELTVTIGEMAIAPDRRTALMDMAVRLEVAFLRRVVTTIAQSLQLGAPLSRALRQLSQELRQEHLVRIETWAGRLPVLLTIPLVLFIMPTVLLVVCGPALIQVLRSF